MAKTAATSNSKAAAPAKKKADPKMTREEPINLESLPSKKQFSKAPMCVSINTLFGFAVILCPGDKKQDQHCPT